MLRVRKHSTDYKKPNMSARQPMESPLRSPFYAFPSIEAPISYS